MNLVAWDSVVKCNESYKSLSKGKSYKIIGMGGTKQGREYWKLLGLYGCNTEPKIFKETVDRLILDDILVIKK